jgi:hypothetical protein
MTLGRERRGSIRVTCTELLEGVAMKPLVGIRMEFVETGPRFLEAVRWYRAEWLRDDSASTDESLTEHEGKPLTPAEQ